MRPVTAIWTVMLVAAPVLGFAQDIPYPDFGSIANNKTAGPASDNRAVPPVQTNIPGTITGRSANTEKGGSRSQGGDVPYPDWGAIKKTGPAGGSVPQDAQAAKQEAWRKSMARVPLPKKGCFNASYPNMEWKEVPCATKPPPPPLPRPGQGAGRGSPDIVGGGGSGDFAASVSGTISTAIGSFISVTPGASETDSLDGIKDSFTLQLNSNFFTTSLCNGVAGCYGWVQFVFTNNTAPQYCGSCLSIWYWLYSSLGTTLTCPAGWTQDGADCYLTPPAASVTPVTTADLGGLILTGEAAGGTDTVILAPGSGLIATGQDSTLNLEQVWSKAEFNVFGDGNSSRADFGTGTTIVVETSVEDGTTNPPSCAQSSFTGETNNLNLANTTASTTLVCCPYGGATPNIQFMETNAGHTATCGAAKLEGDPHITTADGTHYDFQGAGEFVSLRDSSDEIQTRQAPISTTFIGTDGYDGLTTCVSLNTAVAARVGEHRVTYEPNLSGVPDPSGLQLRIDGVLTAVGPQGRDLGNGGRVMKT
jgi:hypothetical protein